ncbi:EamA family transporter [Gryllotalpicola sp.]|uniref:DMT family transporter n=1 Tax=Gryllotalpicola sp. TaxID=1932787 RepID=UPI00260542C8|nr:EamA family transporter [Gryllotalpicola sp.]
MPFLLVLLPCLLWGTTGTAANFMPGVDALAIGACAQGLGGLLYFCIYAKSSWRAMWSKGTRRWVLIGAVGTLGYPVTYYPALKMAPMALVVTVALGSAPVFAALLEAIFDRARLSWQWMLGTGLGIVGVVLLALGAQRAIGEGDAENVPLALVLSLAAGVSYALYAYASRKAIEKGVSPTAAMGAMFGESSLVLIPMLIVLGGPILASWQNVAVAAYLAIFPLCLAYIMFAHGLRTVSASVALTVTLAEPAVAAVLAVFVVRETVSVGGWLGIVLIAAGIVLASFTARAKPESGPITGTL